MEKFKQFLKKNKDYVIAAAIAVAVIIMLLFFVGANSQPAKDSLAVISRSYSLDSTYKARVIVKRNTVDRKHRMILYLNSVLVVILGAIMILVKN